MRRLPRAGPGSTSGATSTSSDWTPTPPATDRPSSSSASRGPASRPCSPTGPWATAPRTRTRRVVMHFVGSSPHSSDWRAMLRRIMGELGRHARDRGRDARRAGPAAHRVRPSTPHGGRTGPRRARDRRPGPARGSRRCAGSRLAASRPPGQRPPRRLHAAGPLARRSSRSAAGRHSGSSPSRSRSAGR